MDIKERLDKLINDTKGTILSQEKIFDSGFIKIYKEEYKLPDGRVINKQRISKNDGKNAAIVITRTIDNKYLIVFQNRVNNNVSAEFPSGYIEPNEDVLQGSLREVEEETGYSSTSAILLDTTIPNIGTEMSKLYIVFVDKAEKKFKQNLDADEYINYELFTFEELEYLINNNYIMSNGNKLAFFHLKELLNKEKSDKIHSM